MQVASDVQHGGGAMWRHARESLLHSMATGACYEGFTVYDYAKHMLKLGIHL